MDEVDEMLKASIQVGLSAQKHDMLEVGVVDVSVYSKQPFENHFYDVHEILREWDANI